MIAVEIAEAIIDRLDTAWWGVCEKHELGLQLFLKKMSSQALIFYCLEVPLALSSGQYMTVQYGSEHLEHEETYLFIQCHKNS